MRICNLLLAGLTLFRHPTARPPVSGASAPRRYGPRALRIVLTYALFATLWILFSDQALALFIPGRDDLIRWGTFKGIAFVAVTSLLLFVLIRQALGALERGHSAERTAEQEEHFSAAMIESLPGILYLYDAQLRFIRWNQNFERASGYTSEEIARMSPIDFFDRADQERLQARTAEVFARGGSSLEAPFRAKDGTFTPYFFTGRRIEFEGRPCLVGVGIDVSELHAAQARLAEQASLLRIAGTAARLGGWAIELPERKLIWSDEVRAIHDAPPGYQPTLAEGLAFFVPEHRPVVQELIRACERDGTPYDIELEKITATGRRIWVRSMGEAVRNAEGRIIRLQGAFQDVTDRKRADLRLREQAQLLDKAQDAIVVRDLAHRVRFWNHSAERLYGWSAEEAIGRTVVELFYPDPTAFEASTAILLERGEWLGEVEQVTKQGPTVVVEGRWTLVRDDLGTPTSVLAINTDITQRKQLERQFLRAQRLESIGTLAGGIAHDLNNVLAPIIMSIDLLKDSVTDIRDIETLDLIGASARRGAEMVRQVLSFARGVEGRRMVVHLRDVVRDVAVIAHDTFPKNIALTTQVADDLWALEADPTQLQQVLLNLCVNARDALETGGRIAIRAENVTIDEDYAAMHLGAEVGPYIRLEVDDTGTGIPQGIIDKIFDPFFTTKEFGKGTGLGLATTQAIVKSHGGFIGLQSDAGVGTRFRVYLPARLDSAHLHPEETVQDLPRGGGETILVVDDEASIREVTKRTLETFGYNVLLAADGAEAVKVFTAHRQEIALVLTDMMMPVMDGLATIRALHHLDPEVRIIAASGIAAHQGVTATAGGQVKEFLPKPYSATTLLQVIRRALGEP